MVLCVCVAGVRVRRGVLQSGAAAGACEDDVLLSAARAALSSAAHHEAAVLRQTERVVGRRLQPDSQESAVSDSSSCVCVCV